MTCTLQNFIVSILFVLEALTIKSWKSLVTLFESWSTKVCSSEVVVACRPFCAIFFKGLLVLGQTSLFQFEGVLSVTHPSERSASGCFESLFGLKLWLEVHPVFSSIAETCLYNTINLRTVTYFFVIFHVSNISRNGHVFVVS